MDSATTVDDGLAGAAGAAGAPGAPGRGGAGTGTGTGWRAGKVVDLELDRPLPALSGAADHAGGPYGWAYVLVRLHGQPLGALTVPLADAPLAPDALAAAVRDGLGDAVADHADADDAAGGPGACARPFALGTDPPLVSVVVATHRRPEAMVACVASVLAGDHEHLDVVVVDNSPDDPRTRAAFDRHLAADGRARYVAEPRPGTSAARNAGLAAARGEVVAITDDDVLVDRGWVRTLTAALLADDATTCVTGLTQPAELITEPQLWFEQYGGMGGGWERRDVHLDMDQPPTALFPFTPAVGASNNMAVRRSAVAALGGFDERLGPGTPTLGGEDLDLFIRLLLAGGRITYEPRGLVWHRHRRDEADLRRHVFGYGVGSVAVLTKWSLRRPELRRSLVRNARRLPSAFGPKTDDAGPGPATAPPPAHLARAQLAGGALGPLRWSRAAARHRRRP